MRVSRISLLFLVVSLICSSQAGFIKYLDTFKITPGTESPFQGSTLTYQTCTAVEDNFCACVVNPTTADDNALEYAPTGPQIDVTAGGGRELFIIGTGFSGLQVGQDNINDPGFFLCQIPVAGASFCEHTLDGYNSNPDDIDTFEPFGISGTDAGCYDLTQGNAYAIHIRVKLQFGSRLNISLFEQDKAVVLDQTINGNGLHMVADISSTQGNKVDLLFPFDRFQLFGNTDRQRALTCLGAIDLHFTNEAGQDLLMDLYYTWVNFISGSVWIDCTAPFCIFTSGTEQPVVGRTVNVFKRASDGTFPLLLTRVTNDDGYYEFPGGPGVYRICVAYLPGETFPTAANSGSSCASIFDTNGCRTVTVDQIPENYIVTPTVETSPLNDRPNQDFPIYVQPTLSIPPNANLLCTFSPLPPPPSSDPTNPVGTASAVGGGCGTTSLTFSDSSNPTACKTYAITRTWSLLNGAGVTVQTGVQVINVADNNGPSVGNSPAVPDLNCGACTSTICLGIPNANDDCSGPANFVTFADTNPGGSCSTPYTRTFTFEDSCGNRNSGTQLYTITDTQDPIWSSTLVSPVSVNCDQSYKDTNIIGTRPVATDSCPGNIAYEENFSEPGDVCPISVIRTITATDFCQRSITQRQVINIAYPTPILNIPQDASVNCDAAGGGSTVPGSGSPVGTATVAAGSCAVVTFKDTANGGTCGGITRTWTASNKCTSTSGSQFINVSDSAPPIWTPSTLTPTSVACSDVDTITALPPPAKASDVCTPTGLVVSQAVVVQTGGDDCFGTFTRTYTATDGCENKSSIVQIVTYKDTQAPAISVPAPITIKCTDPRNAGSALVGTAIADDICNSVTSLISTDTFTPTNTVPECRYTITRTWTATDSCQNQASAVQQIIVVDDIAPVVEYPPDRVVTCNAATGIDVLGTVAVTDSCHSNQIQVTVKDTTATAACPNINVITRTFSVSDGCVTVSSAQKISVQVNIPPSIVAPPPTTVDCDGNTDVPPLARPSVFFGCGVTSADSLTYNDGPTTGDECLDLQFIRTWYVTDICGQQASDTQVISLTDDVPPTLDVSSLPPARLNLTCSEAIPNYVVTGTDNCDPNPTVIGPIVRSQTGVQIGECPPDEIILRTWTIEDVCGNRPPQSEWFTQVITIDNTPAAACTPVDCVPAPCDQSRCPKQPTCDCCGAAAVPCNPVNCASTPCAPASCTPVPCSGCDIPVSYTTCQPRVCPPVYVYVDDNDVVASDRGPIINLKQVKNARVSGAGQVVVSSLLVLAAFASIFVALF